MSKLPRRDPPRYIDLNENEVAQLQLQRAGIKAPTIAGACRLLAEHGILLDRNTVLLRSFRNV